MRALLLLIFPKYTLWEILDVWIDRNTYYCTQVRMNVNTGYKQFKTIPIIDSHPYTYYSERKEPDNISIGNINGLTSKK